MPSFVPEGNRSLPSDNEQRSLWKLVDLLGGGTGGGSGTIGLQQVYIDRDPLPPDTPSKPALNFPSGGGPITQWNVATQTWV